MGLCVPQQCDTAAIEKAIVPLLERYASDAHWENPQVALNFSSQYVTDSRTFSTATIISLVLLGLLFAIAGFATLIDLTSIGDVEGYDCNELKKYSKFSSSKQYETVTMQRKKHWAQWVMASSLIRNLNKLNIYQKPYRDMQRRHRKVKQFTETLSVFNGIKATCFLYGLLGNTYFFAWYSILSTNADVDTNRKELRFMFIYGAFYTVPILFMTSGFLQTISFFNVKRREKNPFTQKRMLSFYFRRLIKYWPILIATQLVACCLVPFVGSGPVWSTYA